MFNLLQATIRKFKPLFDRVLVERFAPELKTKGGILIPEKAQGKVLDATVVAVGPGQKDKVSTVNYCLKFAPFVCKHIDVCTPHVACSPSPVQCLGYN